MRQVAIGPGQEEVFVKFDPALWLGVDHDHPALDPIGIELVIDCAVERIGEVDAASIATDLDHIGHIPAAVLATWGVDSNWGKVFGGSRPTQRTSRKRPPLTARRGIHSGSQAAAFQKLSLKFLHGG
jgi:hypothetical protein